MIYDYRCFDMNLNYKYFSYNSTIRCIISTIKCIRFEPIHYVINLNIILSFMIFSNFDFMSKLPTNV